MRRYMFRHMYNRRFKIDQQEPDSDVGSSYPGGGEAPKGMAVRHLKRYASWVQTVVRQVGLLSTAGA